MVRLRPVGLRRRHPRAQVPNIAHGLRCDAKLCRDTRRQGVAHLSIRLGFKDLDRLSMCKYALQVTSLVAALRGALLGRTSSDSPYLFPAECRGRSWGSFGLRGHARACAEKYVASFNSFSGYVPETLGTICVLFQKWSEVTPRCTEGHALAPFGPLICERFVPLGFFGPLASYDLHL